MFVTFATVFCVVVLAEKCCCWRNTETYHKMTRNVFVYTLWFFCKIRCPQIEPPRGTYICATKNKTDFFQTWQLRSWRERKKTGQTVIENCPWAAEYEKRSPFPLLSLPLSGWLVSAPAADCFLLPPFTLSSLPKLLPLFLPPSQPPSLPMFLPPSLMPLCFHRRCLCFRPRHCFCFSRRLATDFVSNTIADVVFTTTTVAITDKKGY